MDFSGKVVLVTGGSSGIGRACALAFASAGASIAIVARGAERGRQVAAEIHALGRDALFLPADVSDSAQLEAAVAQAVQRFHRLDYALNNAAAVEEPFVRTADFSEAQFDRAVAVNLKSVWLSMRAEIRQMQAQDPPGGAIVNTSSINGLGGSPFAALYSMAKAGILGLTKSAAQEYGRDAIRVNALVAGAFDTPMLGEVLDHYSGGDPAKREAIAQQYEASLPLGRIGHPDEAAAAALWLCSPASSYVTGHSLIVDGGRTAPYR